MVKPPSFGKSSPSANNKAAGQTERVVKDVLRVGRWKTGSDASGNPTFWDVTPETLQQIVADFKAMKANGLACNLGKTHGDANLLIHPDDLISEVDDLKVEGDTLWMTAYVTPEDAVYLQNPARKVSVGVIPNHQDGQGRTYPLYLTHIAVTDRPVVSDQAPFLAMSDRPRFSGSASPRPSSSFARRLEIAKDIARQRGISVADALRNVPK